MKLVGLSIHFLWQIDSTLRKKRIEGAAKERSESLKCVNWHSLLINTEAEPYVYSELVERKEQADGRRSLYVTSKGRAGGG